MMIRASKFIPGFFFLATALPAYAQGSTTFQDLVRKIITGILQPVVALLFGLATVIFLWGVIQYVIAQAGDEKKLADAKRVMIWGIVGLFIMASAWGIVQVLCGFFGTCAGAGFSGGSTPSLQFPSDFSW